MINDTTFKNLDTGVTAREIGEILIATGIHNCHFYSNIACSSGVASLPLRYIAHRPDSAYHSLLECRILRPARCYPYKALNWCVGSLFTGRTLKQLYGGVSGILCPTEKANIFKGLRGALRGGAENCEATRAPT